MTDWKHALLENLPHIPFILTARNGVDTSRINTTRVLESLIIAAITGGIVMYGVQQKLDAQLAEIRSQMADVKARMAEERSESLSRHRRIEDRMDSMHPPVVDRRPR